MFQTYDVIVVGAGHAGCEAAVAAAKMGSKVLLATMNMQTIAQMSCNPAMGGVAKGQIVREIDAMGGYSGIVSDRTMIQFRMLNLSKGPAMWSPRTQNDRMQFHLVWREMLENTPNIDFWQDMVNELIVEDGKVCGVKTGKPLDVNWDEPEKVARSIKLMKIKHAVLTSVDRDDLKDMGSILWAETVNAVRRISPGTTMETLIPDFQGITKHIDRLIEVSPEVISHNMETVKRLTREVRIQAKYERSLEVLSYLKEAGQKRTKTGLMLGLGEENAEVFKTIEDIRNANVDVITIGQYLQPTKKHLPVKKFVTPEEFNECGDFARSLGFRHVESSPLVRSSYHAEKHIH